MSIHKTIREFLITNGIIFEEEKRFKDCKHKMTLPFDFHLSEKNTCIEYDGEQHYKPIEFYGGIKKFEERINRDKIKTEYCNEKGIILIRISYEDNILEKLNECLIKN